MCVWSRICSGECISSLLGHGGDCKNSIRGDYWFAPAVNVHLRRIP